MRKPISISFIVYFALAITLSCDKKDDEIIPEQTITISNEDNYSSFYWITISDINGHVIDWKPLPKGITEVFTYKMKELATVTIISKDGTSDVRMIRTFTNVSPGEYHLGAAKLTLKTSQGDYTVKIKDPGKYLVKRPISDDFCGSDHPSSSLWTMTMCEPTTQLYLPVVKSGEVGGRYYSNTISLNQSLTVNDALYDKLPELKNKEVGFNEPFSATISTFGRTAKKKSYDLWFGFTSGPVTRSPVYYADIKNTPFSDYVISISTYTYNNIRHDISQSFQEPASNYSGLDVDFNFADSVTIKTDHISFPVKGKADYIVTAFYYISNGSYSNWYIYYDFANQVSVYPPVFPDDLKTAAGLSFMSKMTKGLVSFVEKKGTSDSHSIYNRTLNNIQEEIEWGPVDMRIKSYEFN